MNILLLANCNGRAVKQILQAEGAHTVEYRLLTPAGLEGLSAEVLQRYDVILTQSFGGRFPELWSAVLRHPSVFHLPILVFNGLTPDQLAVEAKPSAPKGAWGNVPRIMLGAWSRGIAQNEAQKLYNPEFIDLMGYVADFAVHRRLFLESLTAYVPQAEPLFARWYDRGIFFHTGNHPKSYVIEDVLRGLLYGSQIALPSVRVTDFLPDPLATEAVNPNLNHPVATNRLDRPDQVYKIGERLLSLSDMIASIYRQLDAAAAHLVLPPKELARFDAAYAAWTGRTLEPMTNPYKKQPGWAFWSRAVARPSPEAVNPGDGLRAVIAPETRVATAGSCFAQHVARAMVQGGLTYYVAEPAPADMDAETAEARGYGLFSARYGNIYSTRQLLQLIRRAYGSFTPAETAWPVEGGFVDPFRPNIGETFPSVAALEAARAEHLAHVRRMFETLDVFVFTLGLTEGWVDRRDGAAYPVTPGSVTKGADPAHFEFLNLDHAAVKADLLAFLGELFAVNPKAQVILTVSPVPLIATYGPEDVLSATTYSKSVLRAAAGEVADLFSAVQYFPSYEIITGGFNRGAYFAEDLRAVRPEGVAHVMRVFQERLVIDAVKAAAPAPEEAAADPGARAEIAEEIARQMRVVCDEELLVRDL